jgi:Flp pilus assembly protein CpaB
VELTGNNYTRSDWRKLLATRRGTVLVAAACALVAAGILIFAMARYRHNVNSEGAPETVLVASGLIQKGTSGDAIASEQLFKSTTVATKQASTGVFIDTAQLHGKVAAADIYPGQQLTAADFTTGGGLTSELAPDQRAITVTLDSQHGMIGQLHAGDHVDVYAGLSAQPGASRTTQVLRLLMSNIDVLVAAKSGEGGGLTGSNPQNQNGNVTLRVAAGQAGELAYAADTGNVWLVLRPANATSTSSAAITTTQSLLQGTGGAK